MLTVDEINDLKELFAAIAPILGLVLAYLSGKTIKVGKEGKEFQLMSTLPEHIRLILVCGFIYVCAGAVTGWLGYIASGGGAAQPAIWGTTNLVWVGANSVIGLLILFFAIRTLVARR